MSVFEIAGLVVDIVFLRREKERVAGEVPTASMNSTFYAVLSHHHTLRVHGKSMKTPLCKKKLNELETMDNARDPYVIHRQDIPWIDVA
jgi:hypothetical protein